MPAHLLLAESPGKVLPFQSAEPFTALPDVARSANRVVVFIGRKSDILAKLSEIASAVCSSIDAGLVERVVSATSVSDASGATCSFVFPHSGAIVHVAFILLPATASRHNAQLRPDVIYEHFHSALTHQTESKAQTTPVHAVVVLPSLPGSSFASDVVAAAAAIARALPLYSRKGGKTETASHFVVETSFFSLAKGAFDGSSNAHAQLVANGIRQTAALVDMPCNELYVGAFVDKARTVAGVLQKAFPAQNVAIEVIQGKALDERGFGGIWGVGKASEEEGHAPALIVLSQRPAGATKNVVWAGKGIVYDTGGLSIKDKNGMPGMKRDMGAAAAMLYAFEAAVRASYTENLYTILGMAENSVGPLATRPDDIHTLYSGLTVEINNTDAEGRLVLGDCVAYASKHLAPHVLVDMCTLTGAQGIATGKKHAGIVCNDDELELQAIRAGKVSGDLVHPLPYCPEFFSGEFSSSVADMKNSVKNRDNAQSSCAAQFIANHLGSYSNPWLHIDMASPVHKGERATGYGVALLFELFVSGRK